MKIMGGNLMKAKKATSILLTVITFFTLTLLSCGKELPDSQEETTSAPTEAVVSEDASAKYDSYPIEAIKDKATRYTIIYSANAGLYAYETAVEFSNRIYDATGVRIPIKEDRYSFSEYEIVLGETAREGKEISFSREQHRWDVHPIFAGCYGKRLLITAETDFALYDNIASIAWVWTAEYRNGALGANDTICEALMLDSPKIKGDISIMSQNVYYKEMEERKELVYEQLNYYKPDLIGLQEATPAWLEFLDAELTEYGRIGISRSADGKGEHTPIYYKKSKFEVIESGTFWLSSTPSVPGSRFEGANNDRIATWALFKIKDTEKKIFFLNTHLDTKGESVRKPEAELILSFLKDYNDYPTYMSGDFNLSRSSYSYKLLTENHNDCHNIARLNLSKDVHTYNAWGERTAEGDYIFSDAAEILLYKVITEKKFGKYEFDGYVSDHYGVYIKTRIA